jgi:mRNA-degrading endonuclease RelE of RelBE toxin-antitoxin system
MLIVETTIFSRQVQELLPDDDYRQLQALLVNRPDAGKVMAGSGGLRKVRWGLRGRGKRGGVRVIYYWAVEQEQLLMLLMYPKNVRDDLTRNQLRILRKIVKEEYP